MKGYFCFAYPGLLSSCSSVVYTRTLLRNTTKSGSGYATLSATFIIKQALRALNAVWMGETVLMSDGHRMIPIDRTSLLAVPRPPDRALHRHASEVVSATLSFMGIATDADALPETTSAERTRALCRQASPGDSFRSTFCNRLEEEVALYDAFPSRVMATPDRKWWSHRV